MFASFHIYGGERPGRAEVLASSASDAVILIDGRNLRRFLIIWVAGNHLDGSSRTMSGTVTAFNTIGQRQAVLFHPHGMSDLGRNLVGNIYGFDGARRTHFRATRAFRAAIATFIRHRG